MQARSQQVPRPGSGLGARSAGKRVSKNVLGRAQQANPRLDRLLQLQQELLDRLLPAVKAESVRTDLSNDGNLAVFETDTTLYQMEGYSSPKVRWLLKTTIAKEANGTTVGCVRINLFHSATCSAPNLDIEMWDYGSALHFYCNLPARTDLVLRDDIANRHYCTPLPVSDNHVSSVSSSVDEGGGEPPSPNPATLPHGKTHRPATPGSSSGAQGHCAEASSAHQEGPHSTGDAAGTRGGGGNGGGSVGAMSVQDLVLEVIKDPDASLFFSPSPHVRHYHAAGGFIVTMPATDAVLDKACRWAHRFLSMYLYLAARPQEQVLDPGTQAQLQERDLRMLQMFRKDPAIQILEQEFGAQGMEDILLLCTCDPAVVSTGHSDASMR